MFGHIDNVRYIEAYFPTFGYTSEDSEIFGILAQLGLFVYIQEYSEQLKYLASFRHYSRVAHSYSVPFLGSSGIFRTLAKLGK